jgi:hypothetical protein
VTIQPDAKDWTWVLDRRCPECGYDASGVAAVDVADAVRANAVSWADVLRQDDPLYPNWDQDTTALEGLRV